MAVHCQRDEDYSPEFFIGKKEILINIVDFTARKSPQALYAEFPISATSYDAGYRKVNYADLANAVDGVAWWLTNTLGPGKDFETLAYIGPNDLRYNVLVLGAVKAGYKMLLTSPRNSIPAHVNLFNLLSCTTMVVPDPQPPMIPAILADCQLRVITVPSLDELLLQKHPHYPYNKSFEKARHEPLLAFHTSGSTGLPKPVVWSHDFAAAYAKMIQLDPPAGYESQDRLFQANRMFFMLPPFHAANHVSTLCNAITNRTAMIYPLSGAIPTAQLLVDGLRHTKADVALVSPPIAAEISKSPSMLDFIVDNLDTLLYAGGDVPQTFGTPITSRMKFLNVYGSSELANIPALRPEGTWPKDDWKYIHFHPDTGLEFHHSSEDVYELCMVRDPRMEGHQPVFKLYPHLQEFQSGDLFSPHPTKPDLWMHRGRADDIIVFLTGEKTNPISMEDHITSHPEVRAVLVAGAQKIQAALLVELVTTNKLSLIERAEVIERIWPTIQQANQDCPNHARITKSHILFVHPDKPMLRAGKGTVQRQPTLKVYAKELDALYADAEKMTTITPTDEQLLDLTVNTYNSETLASFIHEKICSLTGWDVLKNDDNFFVLGMDSLQALLLTRNLRQSLASSEIAMSTIYTNPTVLLLVEALLGLSVQQRMSKASEEQTRQAKMETLLQEYKKPIDEISSRLRDHKVVTNGVSKLSISTEDKKHVVILTGSTGALGSYLLQVLLNTRTVSHIYCLNRAPDSASLQVLRNKVRNLPTDFPTDRVSFLTADLTDPALGLEPQVYSNLLANATCIVHNAWPVNFNLPLSAFQPQLAGVINLIDFAASATLPPKMLFISSVSSVLNDRNGQSIVREEIIPNVAAPSPMGYGESKYLAERLLDYAAEKLSLSIDIARVGQIAGPLNSSGTWNKAEWLPSLVISSLHIGAVPDSLGSSQSKIDWVPMDLLAEVLVELAISDITQQPPSLEHSIKEGRKAQVFHPLNPYPTTWKALLPTIIKTLSRESGEAQPIETVPFPVWLQKVRADVESASTSVANRDMERLLEVNPAIKLLGFYEELIQDKKMPELETSKAREASVKLKGVGEIRPEWMRRWVEGWLV